MKQVFPQGARRYAGEVLDVYFDYLLSKHWSLFCKEPKAVFIERQYQRLSAQQDMMPERLQAIVPRMVRDDWFGSYAELTTIEYVVQRMAQRVRQPQLMLTGIEVLAECSQLLEHGYLQLFPDVLGFTKRWNARN